MAKISIPKQSDDQEEITYFMEDKLRHSLDKKIIPDLSKRDKDSVLIIDGNEGSGKSTLALQIGKYVDNTLDLSRIVFTPEEFREAVLKSKPKQVIIYDEAFTGLSARASLSGMNKILVSLMMQMRQKNLCVIIVLPTIFLLDKYASIFRSRALLHVFESKKGVRGYFKVYNRKQKKLLYLFGSKTYNYSPRIGKRKLFTKFRGRFYGVFALGDDDIEKKYRDKKMKALSETEKNPVTSAQVRYREQRDVVIHILRKHIKLSYREISNMFKDYDFELSFRHIASICSKFDDKPTETDKSDEESES